MKKRLGNLFTFLLSLLIVSLVAFVGSLFTKFGAWYYSVRPAITPPNWVFPIVWNILYILIAISIYLTWLECEKRNKDKKIIWLFAINLAANALWSFFYFRLQSPILGFLDILIMIVTTVWLIFTVRKFNKTAAILLVPYLLWIMFASLLNLLSI